MECISVEQLQGLLRNTKVLDFTKTKDVTDLVAAYALQFGFPSAYDFFDYVAPREVFSFWSSDLLESLSNDDYSTTEELRFFTDGDDDGYFYAISETKGPGKYTTGFMRWRVVDPAGTTLYDVDNATWNCERVTFGDGVHGSAMHRGNWLCLEVRKSAIQLRALPVCVARWIFLSASGSTGETVSVLQHSKVFQFLRWADAFWRPQKKQRAEWRGPVAPLLVRLQRLVRKWLRLRSTDVVLRTPAATEWQHQPAIFTSALKQIIKAADRDAAIERAAFLGSAPNSSSILERLPEEVMLKVLSFVDPVELLTNFSAASYACRRLLFDAMQHKGAPAVLQNLRDRFRLVVFCKRAAEIPRKRGKNRVPNKVELLHTDEGTSATDTNSELGELEHSGGDSAAWSLVVPLKSSCGADDWIAPLLQNPRGELRSMLIQTLSQLWRDAKGETSLGAGSLAGCPRYAQNRGFADGGQPFPTSSHGDREARQGARCGLKLTFGGCKSTQPARAQYRYDSTYDLYHLRLRVELLPYDCARALCVEFHCFLRGADTGGSGDPDIAPDISERAGADQKEDGVADVAAWFDSAVEVYVDPNSGCGGWPGFLVKTDHVNYFRNRAGDDSLHSDSEDSIDGCGTVRLADRPIFTGHRLSSFTNLPLGG
eukprot:g15917.t1